MILNWNTFNQTMKIKVIKKKPSELQKFFSAPLDFEQRVEKAKLLVMEKLLQSMEKLGMNRSKLAEEMEISSAGVSKMLRGTNNFTVATLVKAAEAVDCEISINFKPKGHEEVWCSYDKERVHADFKPNIKKNVISSGLFVSNGLDLNEVPSYAA